MLPSTKLSNALHCTLPTKLSSRSQAHSGARSQVHSQLHLMTLPACLTIRSQVSSQNTLKHTPEYALKYTSNYTWCHNPSLLEYMLPSELSRCSQVHSRARSLLHSPEAKHSQSHLTICSHVCSWVLDPETCWVAGTMHREVYSRWRVAEAGRQAADGASQNHDVGRYHSLNHIFSVGTATRSHNVSLSWYSQLQPSFLQER